jgi:hypothetical protein
MTDRYDEELSTDGFLYLQKPQLPKEPSFDPLKWSHDYNFVFTLVYLLTIVISISIIGNCA